MRRSLCCGKRHFAVNKQQQPQVHFFFGSASHPQVCFTALIYRFNLFAPVQRQLYPLASIFYHLQPCCLLVLLHIWHPVLLSSDVDTLEPVDQLTMGENYA